jgi:hypothetical protein
MAKKIAKKREKNINLEGTLNILLGKEDKFSKVRW